ncbi:MAG: regulatory protein FmdB family [Chloroflexi bacterium]|jgi:putative FmdB family regulatory protein|nr:regulatory protein FmdB family [Chloroflexota bacterium]
MPTYEYQCVSCGHRFEKFQSFSAEPIKNCPVCAEPVKKVISAAGIIFKGSGWYITDSKKANSAVAASSTEKKTESDSSSSGEKPATGGEGEAAKPAESAPSETKPAASKPTDTKTPNAAA